MSRDYLVQGDKAYVCLLSYRGSYVVQGTLHQVQEEEPVPLHMSRENGVWKVDQLAKQ